MTHTAVYATPPTDVMLTVNDDNVNLILGRTIIFMCVYIYIYIIHSKVYRNLHYFLIEHFMYFFNGNF